MGWEAQSTAALGMDVVVRSNWWFGLKLKPSSAVSSASGGEVGLVLISKYDCLEMAEQMSLHVTFNANMLSEMREELSKCST